MSRLLKEITEIKSGLTVNHLNFIKSNQFLAYLQVKDFDEWGNLQNINEIKKIEPYFYREYVLRENDILFAAKGTRNYAVTFKRKNFDAIASSSFFVIKVNKDFVQPDFLCWYLNNSIAQNYFKTVSKGVITPSVTKEELSYLEVKIPPINEQENIACLSKLIKKENALVKKIEEKKSKFIEHLIYRKIKNTSK